MKSRIQESPVPAIEAEEAHESGSESENGGATVGLLTHQFA